MREIKYAGYENGKRVYGTNGDITDETGKQFRYSLNAFFGLVAQGFITNVVEFTGLEDKNGSGLTEVYEGDIISIDGTLKGNIYETNKEATDIIIPQLGTKAWHSTYKEAVVRGYDYSE